MSGPPAVHLACSLSARGPSAYRFGVHRTCAMTPVVQLPMEHRQQRTVWLADTFSSLGETVVKGAPLFKALARLQPYVWPLTPYWLRRMLIAALLKVRAEAERLHHSSVEPRKSVFTSRQLTRKFLLAEHQNQTDRLPLLPAHTPCTLWEKPDGVPARAARPIHRGLPGRKGA